MNEPQVPAFHDPARVGTLFYPDLQAVAAEAAAARLPAAAADRERVHLLLIDMQVDFCHPRGALYVPGAADDIRRVIAFVFRNAARITGITCSLDTHLPFQIFHPAWWVDAAGHHPPPFTTITTGDVDAGRWRPTRDAAWSRIYVHRLEQEARKQLTVWPYHVPLGAPGHALDPELWSVVFWHAVARQAQPTWWTKGSTPGTEHYSILKPEVEVEGSGRGDFSADFLRLVSATDRLYIAGEAASHCVLETVEDMVDALAAEPELLARIRILADCTSPVVHPEVDFAALTRERFTALAARGARFVASTDPL